MMYTRTCDHCGNKAQKRDSFYAYPAASSKKYLFCKKCSRSIATFLSKKGIIKTMRPKAVGSQKARKLKTRNKKS